MDNRQKNSGDAKRRYGEARPILGASQKGVSENMEILPRQGGNVVKTRFRINSWAARHEENGGMCQKIKIENRRKSEDSKKGSTDTNDNGCRRR